MNYNFSINYTNFLTRLVDSKVSTVKLNKMELRQILTQGLGENGCLSESIRKKKNGGFKKKKKMNVVTL